MNSSENLNSSAKNSSVVGEKMKRFHIAEYGLNEDGTPKFYAIVCGGEHIANLGSSKKYASLLTSAPALLAACESARQIIESRDAMFTPAIRDRAIETLEQLNEAIDRARGEK